MKNNLLEYLSSAHNISFYTVLRGINLRRNIPATDWKVLSPSVNKICHSTEESN